MKRTVQISKKEPQKSRPPFLWDEKLKHLAKKVKYILEQEEQEYGAISKRQMVAS